jgi:hypothetical protein
MSKGKLAVFNDNAEIILSKEENEVFYDYSDCFTILNTDMALNPGVVKTKIEVEPQISAHDVSKKWYNLMQKCKYNRERFSGYYFDEETNTIYSLINVFIAATSFEGNEVKLEFHYGDKTEVLFPSDDEINAFVETYINEIKHTRG